MTLAIDGGTPVRDRPWPSWPPPLDDAQRKLLDEVLASGRWGANEGPFVGRLAAEFAERCGVPHGVGVTNGTLALFVALRALGVGQGDEVIVPGYTFVACATSVLLAGATPVVVDVDREHLHLDPAAVAAAAGPRTAAVMPVHLAGSPADLDALCALAGRLGIAVVEDCAQAHGATFRGRPVGGWGDAGMFSFQSSKAMTAGEGGLLVCREPETYQRAWSVVNVGRRLGGAWYEHPELGWNLRLTEPQAAILLPWLDRLADEIATREAFATRLAAGLAGAGLPVEPVPAPPGTTRDTRHLLMLRLHLDLPPDRRSWLLSAMAAEGVPLDAGYPPLGTLPAVAGATAATRHVGVPRALRRNVGRPHAVEARVADCPAAERAAKTVGWLRQPMLMAPAAEADDVVAAFAKVLAAIPR